MQAGRSAPRKRRPYPSPSTECLQIEPSYVSLLLAAIIVAATPDGDHAYLLCAEIVRGTPAPTRSAASPCNSDIARSPRSSSRRFGLCARAAAASGFRILGRAARRLERERAEVATAFPVVAASGSVSLPSGCRSSFPKSYLRDDDSEADRQSEARCLESSGPHGLAQAVRAP